MKKSFVISINFLILACPTIFAVGKKEKPKGYVLDLTQSVPNLRKMVKAARTQNTQSAILPQDMDTENSTERGKVDDQTNASEASTPPSQPIAQTQASTPPTTDTSLFQVNQPSSKAQSTVASTPPTASEQTANPDNNHVASQASDANKITHNGTTPAAIPVPAVKITTNVHFDKQKAHYMPRQYFETPQAFIGVGYIKVTQDIQNIAADKPLTAQDIDFHRSQVAKALRDIYGYYDKAIKAKNFGQAKKHIIELQTLALAAKAHNVLPEDKKDNIIACVHNYNQLVNEHETSQKNEIDKWRYVEKENNQTKEKYKEYFDVHQLAKQLGCEDDYMQALEDLEHLDQKAITKEERPHFGATIASLLSDLSYRAETTASLDQEVEFITYFEQALATAHTKNIAIDPQQMIVTNKVIDSIQKRNTTTMANALQRGLSLELQLKRAKAKIYTISKELFDKKVIDQLETPDENSFEAYLASVDKEQ